MRSERDNDLPLRRGWCDALSWDEMGYIDVRKEESSLVWDGIWTGPSEQASTDKEGRESFRNDALPLRRPSMCMFFVHGSPNVPSARPASQGPGRGPLM